jgi:hypothetical protein
MTCSCGKFDGVEKLKLEMKYFVIKLTDVFDIEKFLDKQDMNKRFITGKELAEILIKCRNR